MAAAVAVKTGIVQGHIYSIPLLFVCDFFIGNFFCISQAIHRVCVHVAIQQMTSMNRLAIRPGPVSNSASHFFLIDFFWMPGQVSNLTSAVCVHRLTV
jgi:hypothetical protein